MVRHPRMGHDGQSERIRGSSITLQPPWRGHLFSRRRIRLAGNQAKGGQAEDVVLVVLRRHAYEWQAEGILCDPGRIAIGLSRASHTMVMDYWAA